MTDRPAKLRVLAYTWRYPDGRPPTPGVMLRKTGGQFFIPRNEVIATATAMADIYENQDD